MYIFLYVYTRILIPTPNNPIWGRDYDMVQI